MTLDDTDARLNAPDLYVKDDTGRSPLDGLTEDVTDYFDVYHMRANDLDGAESDARALGFSSRDEWQSGLRVRALTTLYTLALAAIPNHGTDAAWEAEISDIDDDDLAGGHADDVDDPDLSTYLAQLVITMRDQFARAD